MESVIPTLFIGDGSKIGSSLSKTWQKPGDSGVLPCIMRQNRSQVHHYSVQIFVTLDRKEHEEEFEMVEMRVARRSS